MSNYLVCVVCLVPLAGGCGGDDAVVVEGGSVDLSFDDGAESNRYSDPISPTAVAVTAQDPETGAIQLAVLAYEEVDGFELTRWHLAITLAGEPAGGASFSIPEQATIVYQENPSAGGVRWWEAGAGDLEVASRDGDAASFSIHGASFDVATGGSGNGATGTFTLSGVLSVDDLDDVIGF